MAASRAKVIEYWVVTSLVLLPTTGSAFPELFAHGPAQTVESLQRLGYPLYLMKIIGLAKILGAATLLVNRPLRMVEWAYAGFSFLFLGAAASHMLAGDFARAPIPFTCLLLLLVSYLLYRQVRQPSLLAKTRDDKPSSWKQSAKSRV